MASKQSVDGLIIPANSIIPTIPCFGCAAGKMTKFPFTSGRTRDQELGQLIHTDVFGPMHVATPGGLRYFILFTDDFSAFRTV